MISGKTGQGKEVRVMLIHVNKEIKVFSQKWQLSKDLEEVKYQANNNTNNSNTVFSCIFTFSLMVSLNLVLIYRLHASLS